MSIIDVKISSEEKGSLDFYSYNETTHIYNFDYPCISITECTSYEVIFSPGIYKIECWGASGGDGSEPGGNGAFVSGIIQLKFRKKLYFFIGANGKDNYVNAFNGGGAGTKPYGRSGGGATDIRTINNEEFEGLKSRIIVAAGGGGATNHLPTTSGPGGSIIGTIGHDNINLNNCENEREELDVQIPANQTHAGISDENIEGSFGVGGGNFGGGGGGGGYYGSSPGINAICVVSTGGGGSSFISGHEGCNSVARSSSSNPIKHTGHSFHYSGLYFEKTLMQSGSEQFLSPQYVLENGHKGNGFIRVTILMNQMRNTCKVHSSCFPKYIFLSILLVSSL